MKLKVKLGSMLAVVLLMAACQQEPTLQKYFVEKSEQPNFINIDLPPSVLGINKDSIAPNQIAAFDAFKKINVLAFQENETNKAKYIEERDNVVKILKNPKYQQLMKFGKGKDVASISFVGDENHIDEFIIYANQSESGFAIVRVLGDDMNPNQIMAMVTALQTNKIDMSQLKPLQDMFGKKLKVENSGIAE